MRDFQLLDYQRVQTECPPLPVAKLLSEITEYTEELVGIQRLLPPCDVKVAWKIKKHEYDSCKHHKLINHGYSSCKAI